MFSKGIHACANSMQILRKDKITVSVIDAVNTFNDEYLKYLYHEGNVIRHEFRAIKMLNTKQNLNEDDFSKNYRMKYLTKIQEFHFDGSQKYTFHTSQIYLKKQYPNRCVLYLNVKTMDLLLVWNIYNLFFNSYNELFHKSPFPTAQYRNKTIFFLIAHALQHFIEVSLCTWHYMKAGLRKGAPDDVGGCLKKTTDRVVAQEYVKKLEGHSMQSKKHNIPPEIPSFKDTF
ncbi:hypothetical protein AGLY_017269 [Aphis glycines]|uniref:Uncharacterized protein n=1 Tax=Aphis glycines TaxID=307491 RepID=A0A6G0SVD8_APHGL|nr:hypothetical protein AGLY_017269 [Aphis glycines]